MRFPFRRRRPQARSAAVPTVTHGTTGKPLVHTTAGNTTADATWYIASVHATRNPSPEPEESPMPELTARERKLYRVTTKREQRTAGQLAVRAGLQSADGSGRGVVRDLNALVAAGRVVRHKGGDRFTYTRAA